MPRAMQLSQRLPYHRRMERELHQPLPLDQRRAPALDSRKNARNVLDPLEVPVHRTDGRVVVGAEEAVDGVVARGDDGNGDRGAEEPSFEELAAKGGFCGVDDAYEAYVRMSTDVGELRLTEQRQSFLGLVAVD